jgi:quinol monooxygenase YgiN
MPVTVIVRFRTKPKRGGRLLELLEQMVCESLAVDGAGAAGLLRDLDDPDVITLITEWRDRGAHGAYMAWRAQEGQAAAADLGGLVAEAPTVSFCERVRGWPA